MPDLTYVIHAQCKENGVHMMSIQSFTEPDTFYTVTLGDERTYPTCTCPAYTHPRRLESFGGRQHPARCKHIKYAEEHRCHWHSAYSPEPQVIAGVCPVCYGETEYVKVAV